MIEKRYNKDLVPDAYLKGWTLDNLPDRKSFFITDCDLILRNSKGCLMLVEVKRKLAKVKACQKITLLFLHEALRSIDNKFIDLTKFDVPVKQNFIYRGLHLLQFENTTFEDGSVYWDNEEITENELIKVLSFKTCSSCY